MARTRLGWVANATVTTLAPRIEFIGRTTGPRTRIMEFGVFNEAATAGTLLWGRALAIGVTPTTPIVLLPEDTVDTGIVTETAIAWGTAPTLPTNPLGRWTYPAAIGAAMIWQFGPVGLIIPLSGSVIIWNSGAGTAGLGGYIVVDE